MNRCFLTFVLAMTNFMLIFLPTAQPMSESMPQHQTIERVKITLSNGDIAIAGSFDGKEGVRVFNGTTNARKYSLQFPQDSAPICSMIQLKDNRLAIIGSGERLEIWNCEPNYVIVFKNPSFAQASLFQLNDGSLGLFGNDSLIRLFDLNAGEFTNAFDTEFNGEDDCITAAIQLENDEIVFGTSNGYVQVFNPYQSNTAQISCGFHGFPISGLMSLGGGKFASISSETVIIWNDEDKKIAERIDFLKSLL